MARGASSNWYGVLRYAHPSGGRRTESSLLFNSTWLFNWYEGAAKVVLRLILNTRIVVIGQRECGMWNVVLQDADRW